MPGGIFLRKLAATAAAGVLAAALTLPALPAFAFGCGNGPHHCYGVASFWPVNLDAYGVDLWTDCLHLDTPSSRFATHETWYITDSGFIETGYLKGAIGHIDNPTTHFRWWWGERHMGGTYSGHFISLAPVSTWTNFSMYRNAAIGNWGIYVAGTLRGTSTAAYPVGGNVHVGGESTDPYVYSHGKAKNMQYRDAATGAWTWGGVVKILQDSDVYTTSGSGASMEQTSLNNMCGSLAAAPKQQLSSPPVTPLKASGVRKQALAFAKFHGDAKPASIEAVETNRKAVKGNAGVDTDQPVVAVQMKGDFSGGLVSAPKGAEPIEGDTLTVTLDKTTGEITDWSIGSERQGLAKLGSVKTL